MIEVVAATQQTRARTRVLSLLRHAKSSWDEAGDIPVAMMVPGIAGTLNLHHPVACQALVEAAAAAGATVVRGVEDVTLRHGAPPTIST